MSVGQAAHQSGRSSEQIATRLGFDASEQHVLDGEIDPDPNFTRAMRHDDWTVPVLIRRFRIGWWKTVRKDDDPERRAAERAAALSPAVHRALRRGDRSADEVADLFVIDDPFARRLVRRLADEPWEWPEIMR